MVCYLPVVNADRPVASKWAPSRRILSLVSFFPPCPAAVGHFGRLQQIQSRSPGCLLHQGPGAGQNNGVRETPAETTSVRTKCAHYATYLFFSFLNVKKIFFLLSFTDGNYFEGGQHQIGKPRSKSCGKRNDLEAIKKTCLQIKKEREKCSIVDVTDKS